MRVEPGENIVSSLEYDLWESKSISSNQKQHRTVDQQLKKEKRKMQYKRYAKKYNIKC